MIRLIISAFLLAIPSLAHAAGDVTLTSETFVEKSVPQKAGPPKTMLVKLKSAAPGARLVFVLTYKNLGGAPKANFVVTNPMPSAIQFDAALDPGAEMSVDGGRSWGTMQTLRVTLANGTTRPATAADVTHVRWALKAPIPAGGGGKLRFRGIVK